MEDWEPTQGRVEFEVDADQTKVTWSMRGDVGASPVAHYFTLFMDWMAGPDFERNLVQLKAYTASR